MPPISKRETRFADALRREGLWFRHQARVRINGSGRNQNVSFYLRTKRGRGIVIEIADEPGAHVRELKAQGYRVVHFSNDQIDSDARALARKLKQQFNPETASENRKKVRAELREIRAMIDAARKGKA